LAASLLLDDVVTSRGAVAELGEGLMVMHAVARRLGDRPLPRDLASTRITVRTGEKEASQSITDWREWIDQHYALSRTDALSDRTDYPLLGGDTARNETAEGQLPLSTPRWMLETTATPLDEQLLRRKSDELAASGRLVPPSWTPIRVGGQLLMRTTERLRGVDYRTGKRVWQYPWFQTDAPQESEQSVTMQGPGTTPMDRLSRRVWNDVPYGQITSDGLRVFLLDDLSPFEMLQISPLIGIRNTRSTDGGRNTLVALELKTEGKTLWRLGQNPTVQSELNDAFFLGAPISVEGALYAMAEVAGDIMLVCLDPATGRLIWQQQLVAIEGAGIQFDAVRRIAGATPSYHEGVLICPTGAGATVAVDLADRTLRWGNAYQRRAMGSPMFRSSRTTQSPDQLLQRWHHSAAIASGTSVLVTPAATDNLYCFELVDGKKRFSKSRQAAFYVAGIRDDHLLMVGAREIVSHDMETGRLTWRTDQRLISAGQQIVGRGMFGPASYIVPTSGNELVEVSLSDGSLVDRRTTRFPLGNLIAVDGEIISQGPTRLAVALGAKTLGPRVERMLKENPDNLDALIQKALLLSEKGLRREALAVLQRAREIDPDSDDVLMLSISSMLGELRENPSPPDDLEAQLDALIDTPSQRLEFLALRIQSALRNRSVEAATRRLLEFSEVMAEVTPVGNEDESILRDPARDCSLNSWIAGRAAEIARIATEQDQIETVQTLLRGHLEPERLGSTKRLSAMATQLQPLGVDGIIVSLAQRKVDEGDLYAAERMLLGAFRPSGLLEQSELPFSVGRADALARVYQDGLLLQDADAVIGAILARGDDDQTDLPAESGGSERLERRAAVLEQLGAATQTVDVASPVSLNWQPQAMPGSARRAMIQRVVHPSLQGGESFKGWAVVNDTGSVMFRDPNGDVLPLPMDDFRAIRSSDRKAAISGGLMVLERPGRISAVDLMAMRASRRGDALLWTRDFGSDGASLTTRKIDTTVFGDSTFSYPTNSGAANVISEFRVGPLLGDRILVLQAGDLLAIDASTGETMWRNSDAPTIGHMVVDQGRVAVVSYMKGIVESVVQFDLLDGRKLESSDWQHGKVWSANGKYVLTYVEDSPSSSATVRLVNPFDGTVALEVESFVKQPLKKAAGRGTGRVLQNRYLVLFDTDGRLIIWDLINGRELCRYSVGEMPDLESMHAMWMDGRILILPANAIVRSKGDMLTQQGESHRSVNRIISVSIESGELQWSREFDEPWGVTIDQPYGSPVLVLTRSKTIFTINKSSPKMDVAMIRLSDGETIHEELEKEVPARSTGLTTLVNSQPSLNRIRVRIDGEMLLYEFGGSAGSVLQPQE
jgi:outer membrane protein assembly factor BamB